MPAGVSLEKYVKFGCAALASMLLGAQLVHINYRPLDDLPKLIEDEKKVRRLVLTSNRAVDAFCKTLDSSVSENATFFWKNTAVIYAVGPKTAVHAEESIGNGNVFGENSGNGDELATFISNHINTESNVQARLLYPCSDIAVGTVVEKLKQEKPNICVDAVTAYKTTSNMKLEEQLTAAIQDCDGKRTLVFFSPSGVRNVFEASERLGLTLFDDAEVIAVGPTTEQALVHMGHPPDKIMDRPTPDSLLKCLSDN
ncbi:unnamed protein product [Notodromas monacha]|uniref:Tetrapyrrole biosynthesis uroporphyrinogen III synthase domain-containing protein n=1 Tax=Notodromas monacha TaxID=399045 RepID=A0A7R9GGD9_9CRUS|nr:unnamed protein product [Notodromas monacha]CAG0920108.1 unnamed protein product [Notodromas monacha]